MGGERADEMKVPDTPLKHLVPLLRPAVRARDVIRAIGLLGPDERLVGIEFALMERVLNAAGARPTAIQPEHVEGKPVLAAA
jgi:hypothetical protein